MDVEAEHELARRAPTGTPPSVRVPRDVAQRALGRGERMRARAGQPRPARRRRRRARGAPRRAPAAASSIESHTGEAVSTCAAGSSVRSGTRSPSSACTRAARRQQVERLGVEQHQLLLDADRVVGHAVDRARAGVGGRASGGRYAAIAALHVGKRQPGMRIVVFPGVLRPPSDAALLGRRAGARRTGCAGRGARRVHGHGHPRRSPPRGSARARHGGRRLSRRAVAQRAAERAPQPARARGAARRPVRAGRRAGASTLIVSNPPYIPAPPDERPRGAGAARGTPGPTGGRSSTASATRPPSTCARAARSCSCTRASPAPPSPSAGSPAAGLSTRVAAEHEGELGPVGASARGTCARSAWSTMTAPSAWSWWRGGSTRERGDRPPRGRAGERARAGRAVGGAARGAARRRGRGQRRDDDRVRGERARADRGGRHRAGVARRYRPGGAGRAARPHAGAGLGADGRSRQRGAGRAARGARGARERVGRAGRARSAGARWRPPSSPRASPTSRSCSPRARASR